MLLFVSIVNVIFLFRKIQFLFIQVVYINGIDVSGLLHERVVNLIRQSRDRGSGELTLTVRPNALYNALAGTDETSEEEPPYRYITPSHRCFSI